MVVTLGQQLVVADVIHTFSAYCIPHSGGKMSKRLDEIISRKKIKTSSWHLIGFPDGSNAGSTVVAAVVDSHIQRIVLATEETTVARPVGHRPNK